LCMAVRTVRRLAALAEVEERAGLAAVAVALSQVAEVGDLPAEAPVGLGRAEGAVVAGAERLVDRRRRIGRRSMRRRRLGRGCWRRGSRMGSWWRCR
jgi:hypothetical protein